MLIIYSPNLQQDVREREKRNIAISERGSSSLERQKEEENTEQTTQTNNSKQVSMYVSK